MKAMRTLTILALAILSAGCSRAALGSGTSRDAPSVLKAAKAALTSKWPQWRFVTVRPEVLQFARNFDPTVVYGDFDADGQQDVALFVRLLSSTSPCVIVVFHSGAQRLFMIEKPYCTDGIALSKKGQSYHDYDTETEGIYPRDGIAAYCFEKAGATYLFEHGSYRQVVDSD
jgi:hypothetical protein